MQTTITTRHGDVPEVLKERAQAIADRLGQFASRAVECTVVFDTDHNIARAEVRLHVARGRLLVAVGEAADHRSALDRAEDKLRHQLDKAFLRSHSRARADQA